MAALKIRKDRTPTAAPRVQSAKEIEKANHEREKLEDKERATEALKEGMVLRWRAWDKPAKKGPETRHILRPDLASGKA